MPKPDKTKLRKWDFDTFKQHHTTGDAYTQLTDLPKSVKEIIDVENSENLIIQHNNELAYTVSDQAKHDGVIIEGLSEALVNIVI